MWVKNISKKIIVIIIVSISCGLYSTQILGKSEISGVVLDSLSQEGLPYSTIQILSLVDSSLVKGAIADGEGNYLIKDVPFDEYIIMASYMGYTKSKKMLIVQSNKERCNFYLVKKGISLSEISVTAEKNLIEKNIEKTTINISKNTTISGGTAIDVMQTLPAVDIDIDGNINYRGSTRVIILLNGEKSELVNSLDQIPADQIERVEIINNPSAKYEAEGMSGIINIVLKSGKSGKSKTTLMLIAGYPKTIGGNVGYSGTAGKTRFFVLAGLKHKTKFQTKDHLRENYENPTAFNYYQYDRQDENLNDAFINSSIKYAFNKKHKIGFAFIASKKFNNAYRTINYETLTKSEQKVSESLKEIEIDLNNYTIDANVNYRLSFNKGRVFTSKIHYSILDQLQEMKNKFYPELATVIPNLQNTYSKQINKQTDFSLDYAHPFSNAVIFETGYNFSAKDLLNDFISESYNSSGEWLEDTITNRFKYVQFVHAAYFNLNTKFKNYELQAGLRCEFTSNLQNNANTDEYLDLFPSVNISRVLDDHFTIYVGYNRRINRPTIKMLNPFSDEYADILNMHKGNPDLKPEYVNSVEIGSRFIFNNFSGAVSGYYRDINQAISRVKSASNDSALIVSFINLDKAKLIGGEILLTYKPTSWWKINSSSNIFYTSLNGEYANNQVNNSKTGWTISISNNFKLMYNIGFQFSGYFRSKLPSVMGTYKERYYADLALNKKIFRDKAQLIFKISDIFNTYKFGLDLDAIDDNNYRYSQINRRKNESRYFILSFVYNINGKNQQEKKQKEKFFLDDFDK